jgi:hypothetical protein
MHANSQRALVNPMMKGVKQRAVANTTSEDMSIEKLFQQRLTILLLTSALILTLEKP